MIVLVHAFLISYEIISLRKSLRNRFSRSKYVHILHLETLPNCCSFLLSKRGIIPLVVPIFACTCAPVCEYLIIHTLSNYRCYSFFCILNRPKIMSNLYFILSLIIRLMIFFVFTGRFIPFLDTQS